MILKVKAGKRKPEMSFEYFKWLYLVALFGLFVIPMDLWSYSKRRLSHRIAARVSYFSDSGVAILVSQDRKIPGRFNVYASLIDGKESRSVFIKSIYNDRGYSYKITRYPRKWDVMVDGNHVVFDVKRAPIFTHNIGPRISDEIKSEKDITIRI